VDRLILFSNFEMRESPGEFIRRYGISATDGFLPNTAPLQRLPDLYYQPWETMVEILPELIRSDAARTKIDHLPILGTDKLHTDAEWRRAYAVLGFLTHAYIWGGERPAEVGPEVIALSDTQLMLFVATPASTQLPFSGSIRAIRTAANRHVLDAQSFEFSVENSWR